GGDVRRPPRLVDADARQLRQRHEAEVSGVEQQAYERLAEARFALYGTAVPPDATFTLRLAFGVVKGYRVDGADLPFTTTFRDAFARAERQGHPEPVRQPVRVLGYQDRVDTDSPGR